ncbi:MAG: hypothetical protein GKS04_05295 [Candidatus Mycalebacterium zealandia]|nr:MAG: hypothetical protein GKS04_05295 [Candidatus Mycalebacterium zealandia]
MIKVNLIKPDQSRKLRAAVVVALCVCAVLPFSYLKSGSGETVREFSGPGPATSAVKTFSSPHKKPAEAKRVSPGKFPLKVAGFVKFADRNFAMLVSGGRTLWVEPGQTAFGFKIAKVKEDGVSAERDLKTVFVPFGK